MAPRYRRLLKQCSNFFADGGLWAAGRRRRLTFGFMTSRTIVITGASDGIGAAAANRLSSSGENVVMVGRSPQKTAAVAEPLARTSSWPISPNSPKCASWPHDCSRSTHASTCSPTTRAGRSARSQGHRRRPREDLPGQPPRAVPVDPPAAGSADRIRAAVLNTSSQGNRFSTARLERSRRGADTAASDRLPALEAGEHPVHQGTASPLPQGRNLHCRFSSRHGRVELQRGCEEPAVHFVLPHPLKPVRDDRAGAGSDELVWLASADSWSRLDFRRVLRQTQNRQDTTSRHPTPGSPSGYGTAASRWSARLRHRRRHHDCHSRRCGTPSGQQVGRGGGAGRRTVRDSRRSTAGTASWTARAPSPRMPRHPAKLVAGSPILDEDADVRPSVPDHQHRHRPESRTS